MKKVVKKEKIADRNKVVTVGLLENIPDDRCYKYDLRISTLENKTATLTTT